MREQVGRRLLEENAQDLNRIFVYLYIIFQYGIVRNFFLSPDVDFTCNFKISCNLELGKPSSIRSV